MFTITLLTNPAKRNLDSTLVATLRSACGGGEVRWLAPDEAAEFELPSFPGNLTETTEELRKIGIDMVMLPSDMRRKKVLIADMDSTIIRQECIDELADMAGVGEKVKDITARAMNGELDFEGALRERVGLLKGLSAGVIDEVLAERITLTPGAETLVKTMQANGGYCALVSGGFTAFTADVAARVGFDENRANTLIEKDGKLTGEVAEPILGKHAKVAALDEIITLQGLSDAHVLAVGDGANDLPMLTRAGLGVALHAKPVVAEQAQVRIDHGDLTALLYLQGYSRDEFV